MKTGRLSFFLRMKNGKYLSLFINDNLFSYYFVLGQSGSSAQSGYTKKSGDAFKVYIWWSSKKDSKSFRIGFLCKIFTVRFVYGFGYGRS